MWIRSLEIVLTDPPGATFVLIDGTEYTHAPDVPGAAA